MTAPRLDRIMPDSGGHRGTLRGKPADATPRRDPTSATPDTEAAGLARATGGRLGRAGPRLLRLQRQQGNAYVQRVVQAKLVLGPPGDRYEREADRIARQVGQARPPEASGGPGPRVPAIQRVPGAGGQQVGARGGGQPLPVQVREPMEEALGADFGDVRLHTDARADQLTRSVRAQAFTAGQDIFFRRGQYSLSGSGRQVLAHELAHVVQQRGMAGGLIQRRMGFEFETTAQVRGTFYHPATDGQHAFEIFTDDEEFYRPNGAHWKIVPDTGRMEFVTDPLNTAQDLQNVTQEIQQFITGMQGVQRLTDIRATHHGTWTAPPGARPGYTVHVGKNDDFDADTDATDWYGQPQISLGVATQRVSRFFTTGRDATTLAGLQRALPQANPAPPMPAPDKAGFPAGLQNITQLMNWWHPALVKGEWITAAMLEEATTLVRAHAAAAPQAQQDKLHGLWTLMRAYWTRLVNAAGSDNAAGSYKKTRLLTMSRTDFHSFYNNLNGEGKRAFQAAQQAFVGTNARTIPGTGITLTRWYASIIQPEAGSTYTSAAGSRPVDLLSANRSQTAGEEISTGTDKSMGQYPLDPTGGVPRAVFELRRVTPGVRVPIGLMYQHVLLPIFNFVAGVER